MRREHCRTNPNFNPYGAVDETRVLDVVEKAPFRPAVGTYAMRERTLSPPRAPPAEAAAVPPPPVDPMAGISAPAPSTTNSSAELRNSISRHVVSAWDPQERFPEPLTSSMEYGWSVRPPRVPRRA